MFPVWNFPCYLYNAIATCLVCSVMKFPHHTTSTSVGLASSKWFRTCSSWPLQQLPVSRFCERCWALLVCSRWLLQKAACIGFVFGFAGDPIMSHELYTQTHCFSPPSTRSAELQTKSAVRAIQCGLVVGAVGAVLPQNFCTRNSARICGCVL